jgi:NAD(P)-dependent dehydrogenase (short-subunit alcohol dehydrogenase family)
VETAALTGCRALVTGSSGGIGRHIALGLARLGADVAFNYRSNREAAEAGAEEARRLGVQSVALGADCAVPEQVRGLVAAAAERLGGLEILINNVGEFAYKRLRSHRPAEFERIIAGTVGATFHATMGALPHMRRAGFGRVVNLGAAGADQAMGGRKEGPHLAGKAAVVSLTRSFALEEASYGVTFNVVSPGIVDDRELSREEAVRRQDRSAPVGRPGTSADVVDAVLFLCRRESSFINGAVIAVTGGWQGNLG